MFTRGFIFGLVLLRWTALGTLEHSGDIAPCNLMLFFKAIIMIVWGFNPHIPASRFVVFMYMVSMIEIWSYGKYAIKFPLDKSITRASIPLLIEILILATYISL